MADSGSTPAPGTADEGPSKWILPATAEPPLRTIHTDTFPQILDRFGLSLAVTTYQANKLVFLRSQQGPTGLVLNAYSRRFAKPMGFAMEPGRFAMGTAGSIWEFHAFPAGDPKLDAAGSPIPCDAVFLPRNCHWSGDVQIHEMAWVPPTPVAGQAASDTFSELWFVNTRFSCLATRSPVYSFFPRWRPPFITALAPQDRCHLNGLGLRDGKIRYVTALGDTDTPSGWRQNKRAGGILMDLNGERIMTRGLSMPHCPRWHEGRIWLLESGAGGVGVVDEQTGKYQEVCRLPGFTRGLDFAGPIALVGLSQIRESADFGGIAIAEVPPEERCCGVWAVDTRNGRIAGFVKFTDPVQEIFAVQALAGLRWPELPNDDPRRIAETYELPEESLRQVPPGLR